MLKLPACMLYPFSLTHHNIIPVTLTIQVHIIPGLEPGILTKEQADEMTEAGKEEEGLGLIVSAEEKNSWKQERQKPRRPLYRCSTGCPHRGAASSD
jgi:hypothetical protein